MLTKNKEEGLRYGEAMKVGAQYTAISGIAQAIIDRIDAGGTLADLKGDMAMLIIQAKNGLQDCVNDYTNGKTPKLKY